MAHSALNDLLMNYSEMSALQFPIQDLLAKWWSPTLTAIVVFTYLEIVTQRIGLKSTCDSKNLENTCNPSVSL